MNFETERCLVRPFIQRDIGPFMQYRNDEHWMRFQGFKGLSRREYEAILLQSPCLDHGAQLAIILKESGELIGDLYLRREENWLWLGYTIAPQKARMGYAIEIVLQLIRLLPPSQWAGVMAGVSPENRASIHLLQKLGFALQSEDEDELLYAFFLEPIQDFG